MCDICAVQNETGLSDEHAKRIIDAVQARADDHYEHTMLSILHTLGVKNLKIKREDAERAAIDMDEGGITLGEDMADDWSSITLSAVSPGGQANAKAKEELKISEDNSIAQLFKQLGLDY